MMDAPSQATDLRDAEIARLRAEVEAWRAVARAAAPGDAVEQAFLAGQEVERRCRAMRG